MILYRFESLQSRDIQEGDGREVQDQAVEVHSGDADVSGKLCVPVYPKREVLDISGQIQLLRVHVALVTHLAEYVFQAFLLDTCRRGGLKHFLEEHAHWCSGF